MALAEFDGAIWAGTPAGLARMPLGSNIFERVHLADASSRQGVTALLSTPDALYVGAGDTVFALRPGAPPTSHTARSDHAFSAINAFALTEQTVTVATDKGLFTLGDSGELVIVGKPAGDTAIVDLEVGPEGRLWALSPRQLDISGSGSLADWTGISNENTLGLPPSDMFTLAFDWSGHVWIGGREGLSRSINGGETFQACRRSIAGTDRDQDFSIGHLNGDLGPYMFLGSSGRGATMAPLETGIRLIIPGEGFNGGLPQLIIWSTDRLADGRLILGTTQGLFIETGTGTGDFEPHAASALGSLRVFSIAADGENIWAGTVEGLFKVDANGRGQRVPLLRDSDGPSPSQIYTIKHHQGRTYLGTNRGLLTLDTASFVPLRLHRTSAEYEVVSSVDTVELDGNRVWGLDFAEDTLLATGDTVSWAIDLESGAVMASTNEAIGQGRLASGRIYSVLDVGDGKVMLGTESGIIQTTPQFDTFTNITSINGMVLRSVMSMGRSADGRLWMGVAASGLFHKMPQDEDWQHISQGDGLITNGVAQLGLAFPDDGSVIASNATGASLITPQAVARTQASGLQLLASEVLRGEIITAGEAFTVGPERRDMRIHFAVPELLTGDAYRINYALMLGDELIQEAEVPLGEDLIFPRLEPGEYSLTSQLSSASGKRSEPITFALQVNAFWWERQATYVAFFMVIAALGMGIFQLRTRSIERKFQIIADERRRIAQDLHDSSLQDLFGAQMLGRSLKVDGSASESEEQKAQVLDLLKSATASMRASVMTLRDEPDIPKLDTAIGEFKPSATLSQNLDLDFEERGTKWSLGKHRRFFVARIAQEAINNAAKHAHASKIQTRLKWSFWNLIVEITDDGEGFDPSAPDYRSGLGREAMDCMAEAVSGTLETKSKSGEGTHIRLKVPRFAL